MLIAHGPLGYVIAEITKRWWKVTSFSKTQIRWIFVVGLIGGIFPDIDLFFFYFIDASQSHRQLITHSLPIYLSICLLGFGLLYSARYRYIATLLCIFSAAAMSHVLTDMIIGLTVALAPFSNQLVGLINFSWYRTSIFLRYSHVTGIGIELLIIAYAACVWIRHYRPVWLKAYIITAVCIVVSGFISLWYINEHVYKSNGFFYYQDNDADGILNYEDRDIDGDTKLNIMDTDIDNDGEDNSVDFYLETFSIQGALYDYSNGGMVEIPLRLGMLTPNQLIERSYANVGIFFNEEMAADFAMHSDDYEFTPTDNEFVSSITNWKVWLNNQNALLEPDTQLNEFDIIFFESDHVGLLTRVNGIDNLLEADASHAYTKEVPLTDVIQREGEIVAVGRILPKPPEKQY